MAHGDVAYPGRRIGEINLVMHEREFPSALAAPVSGTQHVVKRGLEASGLIARVERCGEAAVLRDVERAPEAVGVPAEGLRAPACGEGRRAAGQAGDYRGDAANRRGYGYRESPYPSARGRAPWPL